MRPCPHTPDGGRRRETKKEGEINNDIKAPRWRVRSLCLCVCVCLGVGGFGLISLFVCVCLSLMQAKFTARSAAIVPTH